jgi:hypothetical protein
LAPDAFETLAVPELISIVHPHDSRSQRVASASDRRAGGAELDAGDLRLLAHRLERIAGTGVSPPRMAP